MHNPFRAAVISSTRNPVSAKQKLSPLPSRRFFLPCLLVAFLPQWLSGYAFLLTMETNIDRAKEIHASLPVKMAAGTEPLRLRVDAPGDLANLLGERMVVNARQAAILVQVVNRAVPLGATTASSDPATGMHLFSWHYSSLSPRAELESMVCGLNFGDSPEAAVPSTDPEQLHMRERKLLDGRRILPLVAPPEYIDLSQNVRDRIPAQPGNPKGTATPATQPLTASPGAKP
jgi:hypothetical protein